MQVPYYLWYLERDYIFIALFFRCCTIDRKAHAFVRKVDMGEGDSDIDIIEVNDRCFPYYYIRATIHGYLFVAMDKIPRLAIARAWGLSRTFESFVFYIADLVQRLSIELGKAFSIQLSFRVAIGEVDHEAKAFECFRFLRRLSESHPTGSQAE